MAGKLKQKRDNAPRKQLRGKRCVVGRLLFRNDAAVVFIFYSYFFIYVFTLTLS